MTPTKAQIERVTYSWSILADERLEIEVIGSYIYAKGSELACLRLYYKLRVGDVKYSTNIKSWIYSKKLDLE